MAVDEAGYEPAALEVDRLGAERRGQARILGAHPQHLAAADQQVAVAEGLGRMHIGVAKQEQVRGHRASVRGTSGERQASASARVVAT